MKAHSPTTKVQEYSIAYDLAGASQVLDTNTGTPTKINDVVANARLSMILNYLKYKGYTIEHIAGSRSDKIRACITEHNESCGQVKRAVNIKSVEPADYLESILEINHLADYCSNEIITWIVMRQRYRSAVRLSCKLLRDNLNMIMGAYSDIDPRVLLQPYARPDFSDNRAKGFMRDFEREMDNDFNTPAVILLMVDALRRAKELSGRGNEHAGYQLCKAVLAAGRIIGIFNYPV